MRIVEAGSLSAAAVQIQATQPTVSRRLQALEQSLGVRLLQRSTHTMRLTTEGERCFQRAKELLAQWEAFEVQMRGSNEEPEGLLRVAMPHAFGQETLVAALAKFLNDYPRVSVEWILKDDIRDFIGSGIDCAIQVGEPSDPGVVAVRLSEVPRLIVGAPSLFAEHISLPADPDALAALPWLSLQKYYLHELALTHTGTGETRCVPIKPRMTSNSLYALRSAALLGLGVYAGSSWMLSDDISHRRLVPIGGSWSVSSLPVFLTYPCASFYPSRLLRFTAAMREIMPTLTKLAANCRITQLSV